MPTPRWIFGAATGPDGRIYAVGGNTPSGTFDLQVDVYDPVANSWTSVAPSLTKRHEPAAAAGFDGRIYLLGGYNESGALITAEAYDPATNGWQGIPPFQYPRSGLAAATGRDGAIYVVGGSANPAVEAYTVGLALSVTSPSSLSMAGGQYSPNPFDVIAMVSNGGSVTRPNVKATLSLPAGLSLVAGSAEQAIGDLAAGQQRQVTWQVRADAQRQDATLNYGVTASWNVNAVTVPSRS